METAAYRLYTALAAQNDVQLVKWGGSNKLLPIVYPGLLAQALWHGLMRKPDVIYLQDGIMAPLGWIVQGVLRRPTVMTIHGMEVTYRNALYRHMVTPYIGRATRLVAVSNETTRTVEQKLPGTHPEVIFNGLYDNFYDPRPRKEHLTIIAHEAGVPLEDLSKRKLLYTNGRLVTRKGVLWFIQHVMPGLPDNTLYLVSGDGPDREHMQAAIARLHLEDRVKLLGRVPDEVRQALYNAADIFLMPNIPVAGDMEGFGLVALEASSCGCMVLAAKLEGIPDAIIDGQNGRLLEPQNASAWAHAVTGELKARSLSAGAARRFTLRNYSWQRAAAAYEAVMLEAAEQAEGR
jgi:glycosyltransferase involved in cell wall biosynthesis